MSTAQINYNRFVFFELISLSGVGLTRKFSVSLHSYLFNFANILRHQ